jgi:hypothetical protein
MKLASTAVAAYTVTPNTSASSRSHKTWYTSALAPDRKNSGPRIRSMGVIVPGRRRAATMGAGALRRSQAEIPADKLSLYLLMLGGFQERAGDRTAALATMRSLQDNLARDGSLASGGRLPARTVAAVKRLSN